MKKLYPAFVFILIFTVSSSLSGQRIYVNKTVAPGTNNGNSWDNAFIDLQDALDTANSGDSIFVSIGTYYPDESGGGVMDSDIRTISFVLPDSVVLLGGFCVAKGDTTLASRDWKNNETILSGDINQSGTFADNSYHVVDVSHTSRAAVVDGFTITMGNASLVSSLAISSGGGVYSDGGSAVIRNNFIYFNVNNV